MTDKRTLMKTIHGSHLYGTNTPTSDMDYYVVYDFPWKNYRPHKQSYQVIKGETDTTSVYVERFSDLCLKGVPQSLEALFASSTKLLEYHESWYDMSDALKTQVKLHIPDILKTYRRTAWNFFQSGGFKKSRHAFRLCFNAAELKEKGHFDPTLEPSTREEITRLAELSNLQREDFFKDIFFDVFGDL